MSIRALGKGYNGHNPEIFLRNKAEIEGKVVQTKHSGEFIVKQYVSATEVHIRFVKTGYSVIASAKEVRSGTVKDPLYPRVVGVGFLGVGEYSGTTQDGKRNSPAYEVWRGIIRRCYDPLCKSYAIYEDVTVCKEWHNFQNFADWFYSQDNCENGFAVDKDLKVVGSRVYSPQTCSLVPNAVNSLFTGSNDRNEPRVLPKGVHFCMTKKVYVAQLHKGELTKSGNKKQTYLGQFKDKVPAILAYKKAKEEHVKEVAEKYKEVLHPQVYNNLMAYEVDVAQWTTQ